MNLESDFVVAETDNRAIRLGYVLDHAAAAGWQVLGRTRPETALTFCPAHHETTGH